MAKKCCICNEKIIEEYNKLKGTMLKAKNITGRNEVIYVCSECQKKIHNIKELKRELKKRK